MNLRFAEFTLDADRRLLLRAGSPVHLSPKAFQLLLMLAGNRPRALSKDEIQDHLWPDTLVKESSLTSLVTEVRSALGDDAKRPRYVRTVHGFGYAFCAEESEPAPSRPVPEGPWLHRIIWEGREIELKPGVNVVGRDRDAAVFIGDPSVSRQHARITVEEGCATLEDLGSKNATSRRGESVAGAPVALADGDRLRFGWVDVVYRRFSVLSSTVTRTR